MACEHRFCNEDECNLAAPRPSAMPPMSREELELARERANPSPRLPEDVAPGKPDEAPLTLSSRMHTFVNACVVESAESDGMVLVREVAALEERLAEAEKQRQFVMDAHARRVNELATRDARIAQLTSQRDYLTVDCIRLQDRIAVLERRILRALGCLSEELK